MAKLRFRVFKVDSLKVMREMLEIIKLQEQGLAIQLEMQGKINQCHHQSRASLSGRKPPLSIRFRINIVIDTLLTTKLPSDWVVRYKEFEELIQPFKDLERVSQLDRKLLKTTGLNHSKEVLCMFMAEIAKRHDEHSNLIKEIQASTDFALRNKEASIKALKIQVRKMSIKLHEKLSGNLQSSTEIMPKFNDEMISTSVEVDMSSIRRIDGSQYAISNLQNRILFFESKKMTLPPPSHLNNDYWDELKETDGVKDLEAYYTNAKPFGKALPQKEKDLGSFTLPCFIKNMCYKALADLGASVSVMPYSTYTTLGLRDMIPNKLIVELVDRTVKRPKGIAENVLVGEVIEKVKAGNDARMVSKVFGYPSDYDQVVENMDPYVDEGMGEVVVGKPFCEISCVETKRFDGIITIHGEDESVTYQMVWTHPRFKCHTNEQYNKIPPLLKCMTRSSTKELFSPLENPEQKFCSRRRLFETPSLVESNSPEFDQISDIEEQIEEEVRETMTETMEQYMSKTRGDYGSGVTRPKINQDAHFELKGQFLKELRDNTFSGSEHEDANEHIEKGVIPSKTDTDTKVAIQEMAEFSQKWHNGTSLKTRSTEIYDGLVGCEVCKGPHYTKDCPLKEEGKTDEVSFYTLFAFMLKIDDPKKHYGLKPGLLGHSGSLGVDFSNLGMIGDDWKLESKKVSLLGRGLNSPVRPKEVEKVRIKETHHLEHVIFDEKKLGRYVRLDNQSIERDRLNEIGFLLDFVEFVSFTFGDKEMISVIEAIVTTSRYVVPTGRVKVPAGRYVVPTGKDNVIVSAGRTKVIPAGRTILVLQIDRRISNKEIIMILHPVSVEEHIVVQRETKARTILLQSLPEDHMADFYHLDDARDIWLAVKSRFRGNDESKKMRKSMLKQEFSEFRVSESEGLHKGYDRFEKKAGRKMKFNNRDAARSWISLRTKALLSVDSMLNWSDHEGEDEEKGDAQVYGMIAGDDDDAAGDASGDVSDAAAEFALMGLSSQVKLEESKARFVKAVGMHVVPSPITGTFMPPSNKPDLDDTQVTYGSKSNNYFETNSVSNDFVSYDNSDKSSDSETTGFASYVSSVKSSSSKTNEHLASASSSVDFKTVSKTADQKPCSTIDDPSFSFKENVTTPRNICDKNGINNRSHCKNNSFVFLVLRLALFMHYIPSFVPRAAYVPAGSRNPPSSVSAGSAFPAGSRTRPASVSAGGMILLEVRWQNHGKRHYKGLQMQFENVYYVEELQNFKLFFEFQLPENSQVVLRVPRRHNLYSFNLTEIQPERDITYLLAKASSDESTKWHRRMAHVNFKNINKLAKHGLVNGLPSKLFTNDHNCVACNKGKQHKASYKAITAVSTISEPLQLLHMDLFGPTSIRSIDHKYYSLVVTDDLSRVLVTQPHNKTPYELVSGKVPNISHLKPFGCLVTILNTSDHLGKFEGKADEGFIVGYAAHSKAYRVYNLSSKKIEETLNLRYLEDKPNVQGLGHEWYFDLDYLTDSLGYTRFKTNQPAGTQDTNIHAGTQDDSDSECDEQVIVVPSFPSNSFSGSRVNEASEMMESSSDYAEELARLQQQEFEANTTAEKHLSQADLATSRNGVPAGKFDSAADVSDGHSDTSTPVSTPVHNAATSLPPGHSLGSSVHSTRYPSPSDLANTMSSSSEMEDIHHHPDTGIFSSSSYDDDFGGTVTNLAPSVVVDSVPTKRVNTIHPQSQILGDLTSPVQTRGTLKKSKFGASAFVSYVHDQQRNNHTDYLHCLFACFLSQLEPSSVAQALNDPAWVEAMQEEMQQFINQKVWQLVPLPDGKFAIGSKWILKNKRDARGIVVRNKARLVAQGHRSKRKGIDYVEGELTFFLAYKVEAEPDRDLLSASQVLSRDMLRILIREKCSLMYLIALKASDYSVCMSFLVLQEFLLVALLVPTGRTVPTGLVSFFRVDFS
ncbi:putative ribonuclease H-like domain-containing protein [Tanacetum coccineum]